ncbi:hypothetical protein AX14_003220 [Amanita brunnescens Koide BX004]|nr:hypothetical protein AX14_003220 [Amanita brunnescens Koide BX004]
MTNQSAEEYINQFKKNWKEVKANLEKAVDRMKKQHDKKRIPSQKYKPGDRVYLDATNIKTTRTSKKLNAKFHGPFKVLEAVGKSAYKLELPPTWTIHNTFHESKLKLAHEAVFPKQKETQLRPPPDIINREEEHEVETIQKAQKKQGKREFLIKWKGLPQEEASWEPEEHMDNAKEAIKGFYKKNPMATRRIPHPSLPPPTLSPPSSSPRSSPVTPASALPLYTPHPWLYGWDDKAFHEEYLRKLERNWQRWKSAETMLRRPSCTRRSAKGRDGRLG